MAAFNEGPELVAPKDYLNEARGIKQPSALGTKTGMLLEDVGKIGAESFKVADMVVKTDLEDRMNAGIDAIRDRFTEQAQNTYDSIRGASQTPGGLPPGASGNLAVQSVMANPPPDLKGLGPKIDVLDAAKASGKYDMSYLHAAYDVLAKDFRAHFPGYRDYIDAQFKQRTGVDPANARITDLVSGINSFIAQKDAVKNHVLNQVGAEVAKGNVALADTWSALRAGTMSPDEGLRRVGAANADQYRWENQKKELDAYKTSLSVSQTMAEQVFPGRAQAIARKWIDNATVTDPITGLETNVTDLMTRASRGEATVSDQQWLQIGTKQKMIQVQSEMELRKELDAVNPTTKTSYRTMLGEDKANAYIKSHNDFHDLVLSAIGTKDVKLVEGATGTIKALGGDTMLGMLKGEGGPFMAIMMEASKIDKGFAEVIYKNNLLNSGLQPPDAKALQFVGTKLMTLNSVDLRGKPGIPQNTPNPGNPYTPQNAAADAATAGASAQAQARVRDTINLIKDKTVGLPAKVSIVRGAFSPKNDGYISSIQAPDGNDSTAVRQHTWNTYTDPSVTEEVWKTAQVTGDKTLWTNYKNWAEKSFGVELYAKDVAKLNDYSDPAMSGGPYPVIKYQDVKDGGPKFVALANDRSRYGREIKATVARINMGLTNLRIIAEKEGSNPDEYVINLMTQTRGMLDTSRIKGTLPGMMIDAVKATHTKPKEEEAK